MEKARSIPQSKGLSVQKFSGQKNLEVEGGMVIGAWGKGQEVDDVFWTWLSLPGSSVQGLMGRELTCSRVGLGGGFLSAVNGWLLPTVMSSEGEGAV